MTFTRTREMISGRRRLYVSGQFKKPGIITTIRHTRYLPPSTPTSENAQKACPLRAPTLSTPIAPAAKSVTVPPSAALCLPNVTPRLLSLRCSPPLAETAPPLPGQRSLAGHNARRARLALRLLLARPPTPLIRPAQRLAPVARPRALRLRRPHSPPPHRARPHRRAPRLHSPSEGDAPHNARPTRRRSASARLAHALRPRRRRPSRPARAG